MRFTEAAQSGIMRPMKRLLYALAIAVIASFVAIHPGYAARLKNAAALAHPSTDTAAGANKTDHHQTIADQAAKGDVEAQFQMGEMLLPPHHAGTVKDVKTAKNALVWYMLAGKNGNLPAALAAAKIYESLGATKQAARWWYRAGQLGDIAARKRFVDLFLKGGAFGIEGRDGVNWLTEWALTTHSPVVKLALGTVFEQGVSGVPNYAEAQHWYLDAALDWSPEAMVRLAEIELRQPAAWRLADKEKDADGHWSGPAYRTIRLSGRDQNGELDLGRSAIAQEESTSIDHMAFMRPGMVEGEDWLVTAANLGMIKAKTALGLAKLDGITLPLNEPEGVWLLSQAACAGDPAALTALVYYWRNSNALSAWTMAEVATRKGQVIPQETWEQLSKALSARQITRAKQIAQDWCPQN